MINPSFLTKGSSAGTFAQLTIHPLPTEELERRADRVMKGGGENEEIEDEGDDEIEHRVWERCRVDIVKV
jgi:DNA polymerase alpha subunit B